jgi:SAM-dependent methyltransferase
MRTTMTVDEEAAQTFDATQRSFHCGCEGKLIESWLPALDGVREKLERGAVVAEIGCGNGIHTLILANAFPQSLFFGFDSHSPSIAQARLRAAREGLTDRAVFAVAGATNFPGGEYDLITFIDCLHDLREPICVLQHARNALKAEGHVLIVEPMAREHNAEKAIPVSRISSAIPVPNCTPSGIATAGERHGVVTAERDLRHVVSQGGFNCLRQAAETQFDRIIEARP